MKPLTVLKTFFFSSLLLSFNHTAFSLSDYQRGPNPVASDLEAPAGPYSVNSIKVPRSVDGFGGGTIYYPTNTSGTMAAVSIVPGFTSPESRISWWGPKLASHGFVVITIATNSAFDYPESRARQLGRALDYVIAVSNSSGNAISGMVDVNRTAAMGWSMGGGGTLILAEDPRLKAIIPLAPWNLGSNDFDEIQTPTMIMGCENDFVAPVAIHATKFYNKLSNNLDKAYLEIDNGSHSCANGGGNNDKLLGKYGVSWMKRFADADERYSQFLCGADQQSSSAISDYKETCSY